MTTISQHHIWPHSYKDHSQAIFGLGGRYQHCAAVLHRGGPVLMTAIEAKPVPLSQAGLVKMEDRKRPSPYDQNDSAPPNKKVATSANGAGKSNHDADMPWKDDLEVSTVRPSAFRLGLPTS